ncbi:Short transient receptor potential channel 4 [Lamellibrachia satsuma]|nr:Short transient receptor potential channel 4 [Lamellibrachia satsuma]
MRFVVGRSIMRVKNPEPRRQKYDTDWLLSVREQRGSVVETSLNRRRSSAASKLPRLRRDEEVLFELVDAGDLDGVTELLQERPRLNCNCQNYHGYTALVVAVRLEDAAMVEFFLRRPGVRLSDAILHAVKTGNKHVVEMMLNEHERTHEPWYCSSTSDFTPDITPLILAAQNEHYRVIRMLLRRGYWIEKPHPPTCFCEAVCRRRRQGEDLNSSRARLDVYRALSSPSYIVQSSHDPILTAFELSQELSDNAETERHFVFEYTELAESCEDFSTRLINNCRTTEEVELVLSQKEGYDLREKGDKYPRMLLAMEYKHKRFVASPNCQQVLNITWLDSWQEWRGLNITTQLAAVVIRMVTLPLLVIAYIVAPDWGISQKLRSPVNKFISFVASYLIFLILLYTHSELDTNDPTRGPPKSGLEWFIALYILGMWWLMFKDVIRHNLIRYFTQAWNVYTVVMLMLFTSTFILWCLTYVDIQRNDKVDLPRAEWNQFDLSLISEAVFSIAFLFAFGRLMYFFLISHSFGPLLLSLGYMIKDIVKFMVIFIIIVLAFATGLYTLYHQYKGLSRIENGDVIKQDTAFESLRRSFYTVSWSIFGQSPPEYTRIVLPYKIITEGNVTRKVDNGHYFTSAVGHLVFLVFHVIGILTLINMLIAMMSNSYAKVEENAELEWKFARTKLWTSYFGSGGTLPPPFNLIPTPKFFIRLYDKNGKQRHDNDDDDNEEDLISDERYHELVSQLVQRYLNSQKGRQAEQTVSAGDLEGITQQLKELKQMNRLLLQDAYGENTSLLSH